MHELMLLLASKMPLELLLTLLEKAVREVRENPDDAEKIPKDKNSIEYNNWLWEYSVNAPNKPGYYRANND